MILEPQQQQRGFGNPLIIAAIPAISGFFSSIFGGHSQAVEQRKLMEYQMALEYQKQLETTRLLENYLIPAGAVILGAWLLMKGDK